MQWAQRLWVCASLCCIGCRGEIDSGARVSAVGGSVALPMDAAAMQAGAGGTPLASSQTTATAGAVANPSRTARAAGSGGSAPSATSATTAQDLSSRTFQKANLTNFTSYPDPGSEECIMYSGCMWAGQFAGVKGKQTEQWVMEHNIIAVHSKDFAKYKLKTLHVRRGQREIDAVVYDQCNDDDCDGCCTRNAASTGFLIDMEKYTAERFGTNGGVVEWTCVDCD
jgi:hypothetical protein